MSGEDQGDAGRREVAYRLLAAEFDDADFSYSESDEERAPNYVVTPTGGRVNRLFVVGVLTEVEQAGEDILRARVVDPTGAFVVYGGQYQPDAQAFFERADPPMFVAVTGKARTFKPDDADVVYTSVRPENVNEVTAETRDRWNVQAARQTIDRVATMAKALSREEEGADLRHALESEGVDPGLAAGIPLAVDHYGTTPRYLNGVRELASQVAEVVAGERDEVESMTIDPDAPGDVDPGPLADLDVPANVGGAEDLPGTAASTGEAAASPSTTSTDATSGAETSDESAGMTDASGSGAAETSGTETAEASPADAADSSTDTADVAGTTDPAVEAEGSTETADATATGSVDPDAADPVDAADTTVQNETAVDTEGRTDPGVDAHVDDGTAEGSDVSSDVGEFEPGEFDIDDDEREAIEQEYGTDFKSGTEVEEPGEADIETPDADSEATSDAETATTEAETADGTGSDTAEPETADGSEMTGESQPAENVETEAGGDVTDESEPAADAGDEDVDIETAVMEAMRDNDDGDGAPESAIVEAATERLGADEAAVEDALQDALMGGQCYEPEDGVYKPI